MKNYEILIIVVCFLSYMINNPWSDALRDDKRGRLQKLIEHFKELSFVTTLYIFCGSFKFVLLITLAYLALRYALFNYVYNLTRKPRLPWWYISSISNHADMLELKLGLGLYTRLILRAINLILGVIFLYNAFKYL